VWNMNDVTKIEYRGGFVFVSSLMMVKAGCGLLGVHRKRSCFFEPLRDISFFKNATIEGGTISWPNGADIAPETLYEKIAYQKTVSPGAQNKASR